MYMRDDARYSNVKSALSISEMLDEYVNALTQGSYFLI